MQSSTCSPRSNVFSDTCRGLQHCRVAECVYHYGRLFGFWCYSDCIALKYYLSINHTAFQTLSSSHGALQYYLSIVFPKGLTIFLFFRKKGEQPKWLTITGHENNLKLKFASIKNRSFWLVLCIGTHNRHWDRFASSYPVCQSNRETSLLASVHIRLRFFFKFNHYFY